MKTMLSSSLECTFRFPAREGLACSAGPARLYLPKKNGCLDLPHLYKKMHVNHACQLITSCDPITQHVAKLQIEKEQELQRAKFKPMLTVQEVMVADPGASKKTVMRRAKDRGSEVSKGCRTAGAFPEPASPRGIASAD